VKAEKQRGRIEQRELWLVEAGALAPYLEQEFGWEGIATVGWIRRWRKRGDQEEEERTTWVSSLSLGKQHAELMAQLLRGHWTIENGVFRVRDVTFSEDRLHGRAIGTALATIRDATINLLRRLGYRYIPDGIRYISAKPDRGLHLLLESLED
jgi:hypothetical protein